MLKGKLESSSFITLENTCIHSDYSIGIIFSSFIHMHWFIEITQTQLVHELIFALYDIAHEMNIYA